MTEQKIEDSIREKLTGDAQNSFRDYRWNNARRTRLTKALALDCFVISSGRIPYAPTPILAMTEVGVCHTPLRKNNESNLRHCEVCA